MIAKSNGKPDTAPASSTGDLQLFKLNIEDEPDLEFEGRLLASAKSSPNPGDHDYSRSESRWTELELYETKSGKFVCYEQRRSNNAGERDKRRATVVSRPPSGISREDPENRTPIPVSAEESMHDGIKRFFGQGWLAKALYESAGIQNVKRID